MSLYFSEDLVLRSGRNTRLKLAISKVCKFCKSTWNKEFTTLHLWIQTLKPVTEHKI